jgi:enediyne polyketide synthase
VTAEIAIVGVGCRYPDARSPDELWHNALAGRRAFRAIPEARLRVADYAPRFADDPDSTYVRSAALIEDFELDRQRFKIAGATARATDLVHWLALDVADHALRDAGFPAGDGLPRASTGVIVGNSLTGEMSRAAGLRLRWPYVARSLAAALARTGGDPAAHASLIDAVERDFKAALPPPGEDTLAGGLSNTIAGRICNAFDLGGGGFTVDGACSSSLLAIAQACSALVAGDLDLAIAGGVDVSLDPFELIGFARLGALAHGAMRIYDRSPTGFLPGEGAGMVVLARRADAEARGLRVHAVIRGWGIASDGLGGITRPDPAGHRRAIDRCYARAQFGIETVALVEGHGTGTAVGDEAELAAIAGAVREAGARRPAAIGSIKALIGHTKAAAGVAGLLKATAAVRDRLIPPAHGVDDPHDELARADAALRAPAAIEDWPDAGPARAGVSAIGFGGINVHVVVEGVAATPRRTAAAAMRRLATTAQDVELLVLSAADPAALAARASALATRAGGASLAELADLAAGLAARAGDGPVRAAVVAATPDEARLALEDIARAARDHVAVHDGVHGRWFVPQARGARVGLLFTGQAAPVPLDGGALARRFAAAAQIWRLVPDRTGDRLDTRNAQPAIVAASLAAAAVLEQLGLIGDVAIGHSLGELSALAWAGSWTPADVIALAAARGRGMSVASDVPGAMAALAANAAEADALIAGTSVVVAACNGPGQTVVSGERAAVEAVVRRAAQRGLAATPLATSHAFHSPLMTGATPALRQALDRTPANAPARPVVSTVTGALWGSGVGVSDVSDVSDVSATLIRQLTSPVLFSDAMGAAGAVDLFVELGPGGMLATLAAATGVPAIAVDACGPSLRGLLAALGAAWALGAPIDLAGLFVDRWCKPVDLAVGPRLFANPCEAGPAAVPRTAPSIESPADVRIASPIDPLADTPAESRVRSQIEPPAGVPIASPIDLPAESRTAPPSPRSSSDVLAMLRHRLVEATELPAGAIADDARLLEDLHLSSISIAQLVTRVARELGLPAPRPLTGWARATLVEIAAAFAAEPRAEPPPPIASPPAVSWVRAFATVDEAAGPPGPARPESGAWRWCGAAPAGARARRLADAIAGTAGGTVVLVSDDDLDAIAEACRADGPFLVIDPQRVAGGLARTLQLETAQPVTVVSYDALDTPEAVAAVRAEAAALTAGFRAVHVARDGTLTTPMLAAITLPEPDLALGSGDVVAVTGGGKGIAAECALALARRTGCRLVTIGRRAPADDPALAANLARFAAYGIRAEHVAADVTDAAALQVALAPAVAALGPITAIVHAAAINEPRAARELTAAELRRTIAPKLAGLHNLLAMVDRTRLKAIVAFGSIIARTGLPGEAHYALANDLLRRAVSGWQALLPACRCATLEWSAWAEVGMAERIGRLDALIQRGLAPISIDDGVAMFLRAFGATGAIAIAGRLGDAGIASYGPRALPLSRFVERPLVHIPGVELVSEVELSPSLDRYLDDHVLDGARVMPAVLQIEAAYQVIAALNGEPAPWRIAAVAFLRAIVVDDDGTRIRIAACLLDSGRAEIVITASSDAHRAECTRMTLEPDTAPLVSAIGEIVDLGAVPAPYDALLPQRGRFARIAGYHELETRRCRFGVRTANPAGPWFAHHVPGALCLADPGVRDAMLHGMQVAVPDQRLVPVAARDVRLATHWPPGGVVVEAHELASGNAEYTWTLVVKDASGAEIERWSEVTFRSLGERRTIPELVLRPWLERRLGALAPAVRIVSLGAAANAPEPLHVVRYRPDRRPELAAGGLSASTVAGLRLVVTGPGGVACDVEAVTPRATEVWRDLLGTHLELAAQLARLGEPFDHAATRLWTALECAAKLGQPDPRLLLVTAADHAVSLRAGTIEVTSLVCQVTGQDRGLDWIAIAVATAAPSMTAGLEVAS